MPLFDYHVFVCTNHRDEGHPRGCCDAADESSLLTAFKRKVAVRALPKVVRVNKAGCLDQCEHGPIVVVYPDAVWYGRVTETDLDEIIESHLAEGRTVERLRLAESCINARTCPHKPRSA